MKTLLRSHPSGKPVLTQANSSRDREKSAQYSRNAGELKAILNGLHIDPHWVPSSEWVDFMRQTAAHLHAVFPQQSGYLLAMSILCNIPGHPVSLLSPHQLRLYIDNLWTHLAPGIPWFWSSLFQEVLFEKTEITAPDLLEELAELARMDPRNPQRRRCALSWRHAAFTHTGNAKTTLEDLVVVWREGDVHLCMVADGVSHSTVGSGGEAVRNAMQALDAHSGMIRRSLRGLDVDAPVDVWFLRVRDFQMEVFKILNLALIEAIRLRHPGKLLPSEEIMSLTCTLLVLRQDVGVLAQCGDTGAFLFESGQFIPLTREHSVRYDNILARLERRPLLKGPPGALTHLLPQAVNAAGVQVLLPTVGDLISFSLVRLTDQSRLLVTTDGMIPRNPRARQYLAEELRSIPLHVSAKKQARFLAARALQKLGADNLGFAMWVPEAQSV